MRGSERKAVAPPEALNEKTHGAILGVPKSKEEGGH